MAGQHELDLARKLDQLTDRVARIEHKLGLPPPPEMATPPPEVAQSDIVTAQAASAADAAHAPSAAPVNIVAPHGRKADLVRGIAHAPAEPPAARQAAPQPPAPPIIAPPPIIPSRAPASQPASSTRVEEAIAALRTAPTESAHRAAASPSIVSPAMTPPAPPHIARPAPAPETAPRRSVEFAIGTSWFAWVGAIVLLLAGALFITTAYREGWIGAISPVARCISVAVFGALLLGAGEWALRKIPHAAAVGFYGAGLGTLYLDAFATSQWFKIAPESTAFILLAIVALVGFALTLRARTLTIGILSVLGGYLAPILLSGIATNPAGSAVYLTMLLAIALGLSAFLPRPMRAVRYVAAGAHGLLAFLWALDAVPAHWLVAIVAFTAWWCMLVGEALFAALRRQSSTGNVVITLLATAWYVLIGGAILNGAPTVGFDWLGAYTFAVAALSIAAAMTFGPGLDALRQAPRDAMGKLALALILQAGALVIVAIALQFDGYARAIAWLVVGLASIEIGRRLPSRGLDVFGLITGALGVAAVILVESWAAPALRTDIYTALGFEITGWTILALFALAAIVFASKRLRHAEHSAWNGMKIALLVIALLGWMLLWSFEAAGVTSTWMWLAGAAALIVLERFGRRELFFELGIAALAVTAARWLLLDAVADRLDASWHASDALPLLNWQMALAVAIALVAGAASLIARTRPAPALAASPAQTRSAAAIVFAVVGFAAFMLFALSFEVDRVATRISLSAGEHAWSLNQVRNLLLTTLWAAGSVVVHIFACQLRKRGGAPGQAAGTIMRISWIAMILLTGKWMIVDTLLFSVLSPSASRYDFIPLVNVQMVTALVIAGGAVFMLGLMKRAASGAASSPDADSARAARSPFEQGIASIVPVLASIFILWALSFEVERFVGSLIASGTRFDWHDDHVRMLALAMLWSLGSAAIALLGSWRRAGQLVSAGMVLAIVTAAFWLSAGTLQWRLAGPPTCTTLFLNMQFIAGVIAAVAVFTAQRTLPRSDLAPATQRAMRTVAWSVLALIALWLGSLEIDRAFVGAAATLTSGQVTARQMCLSVYWALFAFGLIAAGFRIPAAPVRYAGIALFGITLVKIFLVDLSQVDSIYRIASLVAVGLLLVLTSAAYAKLAPKLLANERNTTGAM